MGYFQVMYESKVVIYNRKMFIRLATGYEQDYSATRFHIAIHVRYERQLKNHVQVTFSLNTFYLIL